MAASTGATSRRSRASSSARRSTPACRRTKAISSRKAFAPQQVEELVTKPIENAVNGTAGLATLRSESIPGLSVVTITFARNVDVHVARQGIAERLAELGSTLPAGVGTPKLSPLVSS